MGAPLFHDVPKIALHLCFRLPIAKLAKRHLFSKFPRYATCLSNVTRDKRPDENDQLCSVRRISLAAKSCAHKRKVSQDRHFGFFSTVALLDQSPLFTATVVATFL
jgi:hypothetical protein